MGAMLEARLHKQNYRSWLKRCPAGQIIVGLRRAGPTFKSGRKIPAASTSSRSYEQLLEWCCGQSHTGGSVELVIKIAELPGSGRGLVAVEDASPGQILLSVPFHNVFSSMADSSLHWSAEMAFRLLQELHACKQSSDGARWCAWLACLPPAVTTPLEFDDDEVDACQLPHVVAEIRSMQECISACYWELESQLQAMDFGWAEFLWAVQLLHSRCFVDPATQLHITVPGVDMANHSPQPSASVRIVHSPGACQGRDALEEVAALPPAEPSCFQLLAGPGGIRAGEEVTISYGGWPSEAFLLLFGFLPSSIPGDSLVLFSGLQDVASEVCEFWQPGLLNDKQWQQLLAKLEGIEQDGTQDWRRLLLSSSGMDGRFPAAVDTVTAAAAAVLGRPITQHVSKGEVALKRCHRLLSSLPTSLDEDRSLLAAATDRSSNVQLAIQFRMGKKRLLQLGIDALQLMPC